VQHARASVGAEFHVLGGHVASLLSMPTVPAKRLWRRNAGSMAVSVAKPTIVHVSAPALSWVWPKPLVARTRPPLTTAR
jgi:hypothetical protein